MVGAPEAGQGGRTSLEGHLHRATLPTSMAQSVLPAMWDQQFEVAALKTFCLETIIRMGIKADICFKSETGELQRTRFRL